MVNGNSFTIQHLRLTLCILAIFRWFVFSSRLLWRHFRQFCYDWRVPRCEYSESNYCCKGPSAHMGRLNHALHTQLFLDGSQSFTTRLYATLKSAFSRRAHSSSDMRRPQPGRQNLSDTESVWNFKASHITQFKFALQASQKHTAQVQCSQVALQGWLGRYEIPLIINRGKGGLWGRWRGLNYNW